MKKIIIVVALIVVIAGGAIYAYNSPDIDIPVIPEPPAEWSWTLSSTNTESDFVNTEAYSRHGETGWNKMKFTQQQLTCIDVNDPTIYPAESDWMKKIFKSYPCVDGVYQFDANSGLWNAWVPSYNPGSQDAIKPNQDFFVHVLCDCTFSIQEC